MVRGHSSAGDGHDYEGAGCNQPTRLPHDQQPGDSLGNSLWIRRPGRSAHLFSLHALLLVSWVSQIIDWPKLYREQDIIIPAQSATLAADLPS